MALDILRDCLNEMFLGAEVRRRETLVAKAKADPVGNKTTLQWADSTEPRYRYYQGGVDRRGTTRRFCWTTTRNAAGYFLTFDEVIRKDGWGERTRIVASKRRQTCKDKARGRWQAYRNRSKEKADGE